MNQSKWLSAVIPIVLVLLITQVSGCLVVTAPGKPPQQPADVPVINSFTASPETTAPGQLVTLSWDVSGATALDIQPQIGQVAQLSGSSQVTPASTITYTLTATNQAGSTIASITVTVTPEAATPEAAAKPDLVVTDIWLESSMVYYKIKNQGSADAEGSRAYLYVNKQQQSSDFEDRLAAGEERTAIFSNFQWNFPMFAQGPSVASVDMPTFFVNVCVDSENAIDEGSEGNNCLHKIWGITFIYDFAAKAHLASWRSGAGELKWPMVSFDKKGAASVASNNLIMCPEQVSNGWIQGRFADFYVDKETHAARSRPIVVPEMAKFTTKVSLKEGAASTDGARVALGYLDDTGSVVLFAKMDIYGDSTPRVYEVDLSDLAGKKTEFILWVEAKDSPENDCVKWGEPQIVQE